MPEKYVWVYYHITKPDGTYIGIRSFLPHTVEKLKERDYTLQTTDPPS